MSKLEQKKFNTSIVVEFPIFKCKNCNISVQAKRLGDFVSCGCFEDKEDTRGFYYDPLYFNDNGDLIARQGGNVDDMEPIK